MLRACFLLLVMFGGPVGAVAAEPLTREQRRDLLGEALAAFQRGTEAARANPVEARAAFTESAGKLQRLVDDGIVNGKLYYDLGNAWLKAGRIGKAIANYRRARELLPNDPNVVENLRYARSLRKYEIPEAAPRVVVRTLLFWHYDTPIRLRFVVGVIAYVLFWALLGVRLLRRADKSALTSIPWRLPAVVLLLIWVTLAVSVGAEYAGRQQSREGVVTVPECIVRKGNGLGYEPQFAEPLTEGVEFEVLEHRDQWLHIRLPDGHDGWVQQADAELI